MLKESRGMEVGPRRSGAIEPQGGVWPRVECARQWLTVRAVVRADSDQESTARHNPAILLDRTGESMAGKRQAQNRNANRKRKKKGMCLQDRPLLEPKAAGIDIGAREIWLAVPPGLCEHPVRVFHSFTEDLESLAQWLVSLGIRTAAMESTGVYWIPLYEILEARGVKPCLVNARHMKSSTVQSKSS